jgi:hypothetical protein
VPEQIPFFKADLLHGLLVNGGTGREGGEDAGKDSGSELHDAMPMRLG